MYKRLQDVAKATRALVAAGYAAFAAQGEGQGAHVPACDRVALPFAPHERSGAARRVGSRGRGR